MTQTKRNEIKSTYSNQKCILFHQMSNNGYGNTTYVISHSFGLIIINDISITKTLTVVMRNLIVTECWSSQWKKRLLWLHFFQLVLIYLHDVNHHKKALGLGKKKTDSKILINSRKNSKMPDLNNYNQFLSHIIHTIYSHSRSKLDLNLDKCISYASSHRIITFLMDSHARWWKGSINFISTIENHLVWSIVEWSLPDREN